MNIPIKKSQSGEVMVKKERPAVEKIAESIGKIGDGLKMTGEAVDRSSLPFAIYLWITISIFVLGGLLFVLYALHNAHWNVGWFLDSYFQINPINIRYSCSVGIQNVTFVDIDTAMKFKELLIDKNASCSLIKLI